MSTEYGKVAFSTSFNPTSAFPLDARSYFENKTAAENAAKTARVAGSAESLYYFGQTLVVFSEQNKKASFYIIQPSKKEGENGGVLESLGASILIDENQFEFDAKNDKLTIKGSYSPDSAGQILSTDGQGKLSWVEKGYSKSDIDNMLAGISYRQRTVIESLTILQEKIKNGEKIDDSFIYLVEDTAINGDTINNFYKEYLVITDSKTGNQQLELVGSWEVDLSQYLKVSEANKLFLAKDDQYISSVSNDFTVSSSGELSLTSPISDLSNQILDLSAELANKYDKSAGLLVQQSDLDTIQGVSTALNYDDATKSIDISADSISDLSSWIGENAGKVTGLSERNFSANLESTLNQLSTYKFFKDVNNNEFEVDKNNILNIKQIDVSKINNINSITDSIQEDLNKISEDLTSLLNSTDNQFISIENRISSIENTVTWQSLVDTDN